MDKAIFVFYQCNFYACLGPLLLLFAFVLFIRLLNARADRLTMMNKAISIIVLIVFLLGGIESLYIAHEITDFKQFLSTLKAKE